MPWVRIGYAGEADEAAKARLIARATAMIVEELNVPATAVNVLLTHVPPTDWGVAGVPLSVSFRQRAAGRPSPRLPDRSVWTRSGSVRLHALDFPGVSPAILIVPGITSPAATWRFVVEALDVPNRVVVLDNRGRGRSDAPSNGYGRDDYAGDIAAWIGELSLDRPILMGHSMGARAVAAYGAHRPDSALIVVDPPMSGPTRPYPTPLDYYLDGMRAAAAGATLEDLRATSLGWSDDRIRDRIEWLPTCSASAIAESHAHFTDEAFLDVWAAGKAPALFVRGGRSPVVVEDDVDAVRGARPAAGIAEVPGAGHMIPWDDLAGFVAAVRPFIQRITAERGVPASPNSN